jgi:lycopene beta-cyclase
MAAVALSQSRPSLRIALVARSDSLIQPRTWSFQSLSAASDPSPRGTFHKLKSSWLWPYIDASWGEYTVQFNSYHRKVPTAYHTIKSEEFFAKVAQVPQITICSGEEKPTAPCIIYATGWAGGHGVTGYQKFIGLNVETDRPHGLTSPRLMDATVSQDHGFRFMYVLPWTERTMLIEDTYYNLQSDLCFDTASKAIYSYAQQNGWVIKRTFGQESGSLPIPMSRIYCAPNHLGVAGGFFHATTGYSMYDAVATAESLASLSSISQDSVNSILTEMSQRQTERNQFNLRLNRMLFGAASPSERYKVFERFYSLPDESITRFYANRLRLRDKSRLLAGRPPVPLLRGLRCFFSTGDLNYGMV